MKRIFTVLFASVVFVACGNDTTTTEESGTESAPVTPGLDNVDGNVPDSNRTMRLNQPLPTDSVSDTTADTSVRR